MNKKKIIIAGGLIFLLLSQLGAGFLWLPGWATVDLGLSALAAIAKFVSDLGFRMMVAKFVVDPMTFTPLLKAAEDAPKLILLNPELMIINAQGNLVPNPVVNNMVKFMIQLIIPFYIFGIVSTAFYLLFVSGSPMGRARAKAGLLKLIISIPVILLTVPIIHLIINISEYATAFVMSLVDVNVGVAMLKSSIGFFRANFHVDVWFNWWPAMRHPVNAALFTVFFFAILFMRYYIILTYTILFPLTIFMYAFRFTKKMGAAFFRQTVWWILSQFMMGVILVGISIAAISLPFTEQEDKMLHGIFGIGGFIALAVAPIITMMLANWKSLIGMARDLMYTPWISQAVAMIGLDYEARAEEPVSPPPPVGPPGIPPKS